MSDDAYIPPSKREHNDTCQVVMCPGEDLPCRCTMASHAVVDSVAAELAEALREACDGETICDCWRCKHGEPFGPCGWGVRVREQVDAALARYDALHREADLADRQRDIDGGYNE